ncbi:hypothetical protein QR680_013834 [Steinernema hermaphroditum]|uniref:Uncharacterized protein n=1 Tax=Steinernema hermaphroditum TaxID=289476 RepID=A0AA39M2X3_9BILA|nr:hypothetical protein QR680_013834 [Steinernema hermaphroditum]
MTQLNTAVVVLFSLLVCACLFVVFFVDESQNVNGYSISGAFKRRFALNTAPNDTENGFTSTEKVFTTTDFTTTFQVEPTSILGCKLRKMDPWDPQILPYNDPDWKPSCEKKQEQITQLIDGKIVLNATGLQEGYFCQGRCLWNGKNKTDWYYDKGSWENITVFEPNCDVVEVACGLDPQNMTLYNFLHSQIVERPDGTAYSTHAENLTEVPGRRTSNQYERPNVYVLIFDSTSTSEFVRSMSRTLYLMKEEHQAVIFKHVNKVGINSRPNAWTLLFGKQIYELGKNPYTDEIQPDLNHTMNCDTSIDHENFWMHRFRDLGYHTMMADDWGSYAINWPNCWGFLRPPAKHYMKPFQRRSEETEAEPIRNTIKAMCHETFEDTSLYLDQFLGAYKNESQVGFIWNNNLAHDYPNGLYHSDDHFYRILKRHEERLNNSFVIIMGDHGMRFGGIRRTEVGEMEDNNPFLMMSLPVQLRDSNLMHVLRQNTHKLITHYDTHVTLHHLHQLLQKNNLNELLSPTEEIFEAGHGSSYFRRRMNEPRDCGTLRIPFEYCLCEKNFDKPLDVKLALSKNLSDYAVNYLQDMIDAENQTSLCQNMSVAYESTIAEKLEMADGREIYKLTFTVLPSEGEFSGYVEVHRSNETISSISPMSKRFERVNSYGEQGHCVEKFEELRPVCYCVEQKKEES